ncbi:MAG: hypothetical protein JWR69_3072 [Pedosphaera sp.]|nr:hypothetical protein [Pedosphaera sp.]
MGTGRADHGNDQQQVAKTSKHIRTIPQDRRFVKESLFLPINVGIVLRKLRESNYAGPMGLQGYGVKLPVNENLSRSINAWKKLNR